MNSLQKTIAEKIYLATSAACGMNEALDDTIGTVSAPQTTGNSIPHGNDAVWRGEMERFLKTREVKASKDAEFDVENPRDKIQLVRHGMTWYIKDGNKLYWSGHSGGGFNNGKRLIDALEKYLGTTEALNGADMIPIPLAQAQELWHKLGTILDIPLGVKRTLPFRWSPDDSSDAEVDISNAGIVILQFRSGVPNYARIIEFLKTKFGNVHSKGSDYINARGYGQKGQAPDPTISEPQSKVSRVPPIASTRRFISDFDTFLTTRIVKRGDAAALKVVAKLGVTDHLATYRGQFYVHDGFHTYWVKDEKEGREVVRGIQKRHALLRAAEVASWDLGKLNDPYGGDADYLRKTFSKLTKRKE